MSVLRVMKGLEDKPHPPHLRCYFILVVDVDKERSSRVRPLVTSIAICYRHLSREELLSHELGSEGAGDYKSRGTSKA